MKEKKEEVDYKKLYIKLRAQVNILINKYEKSKEKYDKKYILKPKHVGNVHEENLAKLFYFQTGLKTIHPSYKKWKQQNKDFVFSQKTLDALERNKEKGYKHI